MKIQMNAGTLRHVAGLYKPGSPDDVDSYGNPLEWVPLEINARVSIEPVSGREFQSANGARGDRINSEVTHRIFMRARPDIQIMPQWSLLFDSRRFRIESVLDAYEVGHKLTLLCKELVE